MHRIALISIILSLTACGEDPAWPGTYTVTSDWNLSGPLSEDRTVGDSIADLLAQNIVGISGVPSMIEEEVQELVSGTIRDYVKTIVDENVPSALAPDGSITRALAASLADVRLESQLELEEGTFPGSLGGLEIVDALTYDAEGSEQRVSPSDLLLGTDVHMEADWEGSDQEERHLEIEQHPLNIRYGALVEHAVGRMIDAADQEQLEQNVLEAVDCTGIINSILGGEASFDIGYEDWSVSLSSADLGGACDAARALIEERVLGMFSVDCKVLVGGILLWQDEDGDGKADTIVSDVGFGGILNVAPEPLAPRITLSLTANRL